ncbi:glycosyltransferase [Merismopedia glauca]|uniref:Glycosyl transferase family 1 n=1 Tax=Merismopedia glauca CCAP 1448/3 TaxID=1296344 RepID=A0A2T1CAI9_9CYAN|nr:glycosyltransferase [Merismopedia glauca]PSB05261.1 glycosyl transferase family 1 [Merismopedia glauca CCAP 1448/3]
MQILTAHNYYQIRGGEDESYTAEKKLLQTMGHQVEAYEEHNDRISSLSSLQLAQTSIWSSEVYHHLKQQFQATKYDLVHVQNFFPLISPSLYYAAKEAGIPVVQTLRNYRLLCPNALFFRNGKVCEDCIGQFVPISGIIHGCYRESQLATAGVAAMLSVHRGLQTWTKMVDAYITLTEFAKQKLVQGGLPAAKIQVKPNFLSPDPGMGTGSGGYALYVGRLSVEKGVDTLLEAWKGLAGHIPLKIIGDGPLAESVHLAAAQMPQVEVLGRLPPSQVYELMGEAMMVIFPSKWYETFGRVAVEAFAKGTPVIGANIGAIAELIDHRRTGLLFEPGNDEDLMTQVEWLLDRSQTWQEMRQHARLEYETKYTAEVNYQQMMEIYHSVCS